MNSPCTTGNVRHSFMQLGTLDLCVLICMSVCMHVSNLETSITGILTSRTCSTLFVLCCKQDCEFLPGEDFSRLYITPYPPTGFWPRLISRMLADKMMAAKLKESLPAKLAAGVVSGMDLIDWVCWRTGIELHLASCAVMRVSRLNDTMTSAANCNANLYCAENWHSLGQIGHCGVEVSTRGNTLPLKKFQ